MEIRKESPPLDRLYDYLHASDVLIVRRGQCNGVVVSSTVYQCLGAGCPILASDNNFFETLKEVVVTFSDSNEFKEKLMDILTKKECYDAKRKALPIFLESNSAESIAKRYIELFDILLYERNREAVYQLMQATSFLKSGNAGPPLETKAEPPPALSPQIPLSL
ncbi:MAG: hypothetical protein JRJ66_15570 [Deltaproteobacteria bacterium]|nr:hypothetical protein [Deltaproteobacteria bacterium]